jgi:hypothetical protein
MTPEVPLQHNLFTGELVDNRTHAQKKAYAERSLPQQMALFKQREVIQFGVRVPPIVDLAALSSGPLVLVSEDPRTAEDKERDLQREAEALTAQMFGGEPEEQNEQKSQSNEAGDTPTSDQPKETEPVPVVALPQPPKLSPIWRFAPCRNSLRPSGLTRSIRNALPISLPPPFWMPAKRD